MSRSSKHLAWFTHDLRVHDQAMLHAAVQDCDELLCVYIIEPWVLSPGRFGYPGASDLRRQFLLESLSDLDASLAALGQRLVVIHGHAAREVERLVTQVGISNVFRSATPGNYEQQAWEHLIAANPHCGFHQVTTHTLFEQAQLPFSVSELPPTFTRFRKQVEQLNCRTVLANPTSLPPAPLTAIEQDDGLLETPNRNGAFRGGESRATEHLEHYFSTSLASTYKEVRNELDGFDHSTKFSPWLANGCLSAAHILQDLRKYEAQHGANESSYWIYFELLWREFFQWHAHQHGAKLFHFGGIQANSPLTSYYPERFRKWAAGTTPYPLVNAIMRELQATGYISNRARQITASCLVNELSLDWRFGAAWFEHHLLDYDVASNWGNWQYLAGVGADKQAKRHFNLAKQQAQFDPAGDYIKRWGGEAKYVNLDSVDAADWPI